MNMVLNIALYLALGATVVTLVLGVGTMFGSKQKEKEEASNRLMRLRIIFQAIALFVLALLLFTSKS